MLCPAVARVVQSRGARRVLPRAWHPVPRDRPIGPRQSPPPWLPMFAIRVDDLDRSRRPGRATASTPGVAVGVTQRFVRATWAGPHVPARHDGPQGRLARRRPRLATNDRDQVLTRQVPARFPGRVSRESRRHIQQPLRPKPIHDRRNNPVQTRRAIGGSLAFRDRARLERNGNDADVSRSSQRVLLPLESKVGRNKSSQFRHQTNVKLLPELRKALIRPTFQSAYPMRS